MLVVSFEPVTSKTEASSSTSGPTVLTVEKKTKKEVVCKKSETGLEKRRQLLSVKSIIINFSIHDAFRKRSHFFHHRARNGSFEPFFT